jgi:flagellar biosynthesis protein FlhF
MKPKRFWGRDMSEALRAVRGALGADALISETKNLTDELGGGVEIIALGADGVDAGTEGAALTSARPVRRQPLDELHEELALLKSMLGWLAPGLSHQHKLIESLVSHGVTPENISKLLRAMESAPAGSDGERWRHAMAKLLPRPALLRARGEKLALVGPSGVGKTATLIKLTVCESQRRDCRVGWVSMEQPCLSGTAGLETYASILGVRLERAASRGELKIALGRLADCDLVLIDTPPTNPRHGDSIGQLAKALGGLGDLRSMLLLSAVTNSADLIDWVDCYRPVGPDALLFTKLDECRYLGPLLNTVLSAGLPLSFITFGQSLAEDLAPAEPELFANLLLTGVVND